MRLHTCGAAARDGWPYNVSSVITLGLHQNQHLPCIIASHDTTWRSKANICELEWNSIYDETVRPFMRIKLASGIHSWSRGSDEPVVGVSNDLFWKPGTTEVPEKGKCRGGSLIKVKCVG